MAANTIKKDKRHTERKLSQPHQWWRRKWPVISLIVVLIVAIGWWNWSHVNGVSGNDSLKGWSNLDWTVRYDGYGEVGVEHGAASLKPQAVEHADKTSAALALAGDPMQRDYSFTVRMKLKRQLRENSPPNPWETGWLLFRYEREGRGYYLAHKTNGLELGKLVPPAGVGQEFLATKPTLPAEPGRWYEYRIDVQGPTIEVYVDGALQITYTDPNPIERGRVGLYTEDAHVLFEDPKVHELHRQGSNYCSLVADSSKRVKRMERKDSRVTQGFKHSVRESTCAG